MLSTDRTEFEAQLEKLCSGFNVPVTKGREEAYWSGCAQMSLVQFARCVDYALGPDFDEEKLPTTPRLWKIHRGFRTQSSVIDQPKDDRDHLEYYANRLLLRHMGNRLGLGSAGKFVRGYGMVNAVASPELIACRKATRALVNWFIEPVREGAEDATPAAFIEQFIRSIAAVSVIAPATLREWAEQVKDPASRLPFPPWMARTLPRAVDVSPPRLEFA